MIYSCFNDRLGLYEYFEAPGYHPTNGDLPTPRDGAVAGKVGIPAMYAGRRLPKGAKRKGTGWQAKGIIVNCQNLQVKGLDAIDFKENPALIPFIVVTGALGYLIEKDRSGGRPLVGAAVGVGAALFVSHIGGKNS